MGRPRSKENRPENVYIDSSNPKLGYAYPEHPPSKRCKDWYWRCLVYEDGKCIRKSLGRMNRSEVPDALYKSCNRSVSPAEYATDDIITIYDCLSTWYAHRERYADVSKNTLKNNRSCCQSLRKILGNKQLLSIKYLDVEFFKRSQLNLKQQPSTINQKLMVLKQAISWIEELGVYVSLSSSDIKMMKVKKKAPYVPPEEDVVEIMSECPDPEMKLAMQIARFTGLRLHSLHFLQWEDIYKHKGFDIMKVKDTKNAKRRGITNGEPEIREVFIEPELMKILNESPGIRNGHLFKSKQVRTFSKRMGELCNELGLKKFTMHNLRKYRSKELHLLGIPTKIYQQQMGHSIRVATQNYINVSIEETAQFLLRRAA